MQIGHVLFLPWQTPERPGWGGGISPAIPWVVLCQSQVLQPRPAQCHDQAGGGGPSIIPSPTSKSLQDDLWLSLGNEALHDLAQYPQLQPPPTAPVPLLPVQLPTLAKGGSKEEPISMMQDLFFWFVIPFCKEKGAMTVEENSLSRLPNH